MFNGVHQYQNFWSETRQVSSFWCLRNYSLEKHCNYLDMVLTPNYPWKCFFSSHALHLYTSCCDASCIWNNSTYYWPTYIYIYLNVVYVQQWNINRLILNKCIADITLLLQIIFFKKCIREYCPQIWSYVHFWPIWYQIMFKYYYGDLLNNT